MLATLFDMTSFCMVEARDQELDEIYAGIEFDMPRVKEIFPDYIIDFRAKAGGVLL